jgi:hypothetical protein
VRQKLRLSGFSLEWGLFGKYGKEKSRNPEKYGIT